MKEMFKELSEEMYWQENPPISIDGSSPVSSPAVLGFVGKSPPYDAVIGGTCLGGLDPVKGPYLEQVIDNLNIISVAGELLVPAQIFLSSLEEKAYGDASALDKVKKFKLFLSNLINEIAPKVSVEIIQTDEIESKLKPYAERIFNELPHNIFSMMWAVPCKKNASASEAEMFSTSEKLAACYTISTYLPEVNKSLGSNIAVVENLKQQKPIAIADMFSSRMTQLLHFNLPIKDYWKTVKGFYPDYNYKLGYLPTFPTPDAFAKSVMYSSDKGKIYLNNGTVGNISSLSAKFYKKVLQQFYPNQDLQTILNKLKGVWVKC